MSPPWTLIVTCEHGGNQIPSAYRHHFANAAAALESHRGWDPGALELARLIAKRQQAPLFSAMVSRLLVELNRSLGHPNLFSSWMNSASAQERQELLDRYYHPYRSQVTEAIQAVVDRGERVLHLSVHSFTPELNGEVRNMDIGLLYDPQRSGEQQFCRQWQRTIQEQHPEWRVRRNAPYRGAADGFTTSLRRQFPGEVYLGIELEVNQAWVRGAATTAHWKQRQRDILDSLQATRQSFEID